MAYHIENTDVVIDGFEKGIADAPEVGLGDMRSANITSVPGEVAVSFSTTAGSVPPTGQTGVAFTAASAGNTFTVASTTGYYPGMAIKIDSTSTPPQVDVLVIGGGGGGGADTTGGGSLHVSGGGGGGGAMNYQTSIAVGIGNYGVGVGVGGTPSTTAGANGVNGTDSLFSGTGISTVTGIGGGGGGTAAVGSNGGSGGGGGGTGAGSTNYAGGTGTTGFAGGAAASTNGGGPGDNGGGGGGGAGAVGTAAAITPVSGFTNAGNGGNGATNSISGTSVTYAGGGGGGFFSGGGGAVGTGGTGGGGNGGSSGTANTGGGAGADGTGGSGIVIISYVTGSLTATGGTMTTSGGRTIHSFTATGFSATAFQITAINPSVGNTYYVGSIVGNTFKLYTNIGLSPSSVVTFISNFSGTYDVPSFGVPVWSTYYNPQAFPVVGPYTFIIDANGNVWYVPITASNGVAVGSLQYTGNVGHSSSQTGTDFGIVAWKGYLFALIGVDIDYININDLFSIAGPNGKWHYAWKNGLSVTVYQHQSIAATDDAVYFCNGSGLGSILENAGQVFDPTNTATYTFNLAALALPTLDVAQSVAQLGTNLLIGGTLNYLYPWDRISTSFGYPLICADQSIVRIVSTNSNAYVFAGTRGRIYITNGTQMQLYKKVPDFISGGLDPYYTWGDATFFRNKLHFTFTAQDNSGTALNSTGGIWSLGIDAGQTAVDLPTAGSLFNENQLSYGTYGGSCPVLFYNQNPSPPGYGICGAWVNSGVSGLDMSSSLPYTNFQTYIDTDLIPIGSFYQPHTAQQLEYKLSKSLQTGESVRVSYRFNLTDTFTAFWTSTNVGAISDAIQLPFEKFQWIQFRVELKSTATTPSFVRLTELRLR